MDLEPHESHRRTSAASSGFFQRAGVFRGRTGETASPKTEKDVKGPLGLVTVHDPAEKVVAELVFIHGLGGGSRKTWTKNDDPDLFWPQEWLPRDRGFSDVRIRTFGYDANWGKRSILNIHDFAKDLLSWLKNSPPVPRENSLKEFEEIGNRISSIFFLATPHRGSNMAELLSRILQASSSSSRPFVTDLHPNSVSIQAINDEFPRYSKHLLLYSYYETNPMNFGVKKAIVVPKDSAVLGYENEQSSFLSNANHREVCKFLHDKEPNYLAVRNGIASVVDDIRSRTTREYNMSLTLLEQQLDSERVTGSCEWITESESFQNWRDASDPRMYWLTEKPGTGKSITLSYVINHLESLQHPCAFYFFTYGDKSKSSINLFLRSIVWQIASAYKKVFDYVLRQCKKDSHLVNADHHTMWRKLFLEGIFKIPLPTAHYLVVDALDECSNSFDLIPLLVKAAESNTLRVFLTSRNSSETYAFVCPRDLTIVSEKIPLSSTEADIGLYIAEYVHDLPALGPDRNAARNAARKAIIDSIVEKSSGCFLWVRLVLRELRNVHTSEEVRQVLEEIPSDMDQLYSYILASMSELKRGKPLTKAILAWTVCATRPLATSELHAALELDMDDTVDDVERCIAATCGQLVYVDNNSRRLAMVCLKYLCGDDMAGPKPRKLSATKTAILCDRSPFQAYACNALPEHIPFVSSKDNELFRALSTFFGANNILSWIEYIAKESDLKRLILTGKALKQYVQRRSVHFVPIAKDTALLTAWSVDLVRLVTYFGRNLSRSPSSIHYLIPPFCPPESALKTQFRSSRRSITVNGLRKTAWDDCSSVIAYHQEHPNALACSSQLFAIGQRSGRIRIHDETTCQELQVLSHQQPVRLLQFGQNGTLLASAASKSVCVWNVKTWAREWIFEIDSVCIDVSFLDNDLLLLAATLDNRLVVWDLTTGDCKQLESWVGDLDEDFVSDRPFTAAIGGGSTMLAVAYRGHDAIVWDIENEKIHDMYGQDVGSLGPRARKRPGIASVISLLLSPFAERVLLAAGYNDGELVVFDTTDRRIQARTQANAHSLVSSPDGMLIACGNSAGTILIYHFETLKIVYRIVSEGYSIKSLAFSANSQRLIDIRGPYCRVWDPPALLRDDIENNSDAALTSTLPQDYMVQDFDPAILISAFVDCEHENMVICGRIDGSICLFDGKTGKMEKELVHNTYDSTITYLCYDFRSNTLTAADIDGTVVLYRLTWGRATCDAEKLFECREGLAITQLLTNDGCTRLLVSTSTTDTLCAGGTDGYSIISTTSSPHRNIFSWDSLERMTPPAGIQLTGSILPELFISSVTSCFGGEVIATTFAESLASGSKSKLFLWSTALFTTDSTSATPIPHYQPLADDVETLIGSYAQRLVFLHQDGWVCSADPQNFSTEFFDRHFFFPTDWLSTSGMGRLMIGVSGRTGNVVFVQGDELAVVLKGLDTFEMGASRAKRPSVSGSMTSEMHRPVYRY
ncbi:hypothetical protein DL98DRAFT_451452 [Cadophora sp. DSE1049]|nr:hypothetical protein DL98DRAFT_451452 [Cadophora sp. DSE1049]